MPIDYKDTDRDLINALTDVKDCYLKMIHDLQRDNQNLREENDNNRLEVIRLTEDLAKVQAWTENRERNQSTRRT